jgi:hypothetical protein
MARWPDIHPLAVTYLGARLAVRVATKVPTDVDTLPGFVRVTRGPGSDDGITDAPLLDVEAFAPSERAAWDLAERAREAMHDLAGAAVNGVLVDTVSTATAPVRVDYSPNVERFVASYRMNLRKLHP